jgi:hypothetical protein
MSGWAASTMLDHCLPATFTSDRTPSGASLGGLFEVQRLIVGLAASCELSLPVFDTAHEAFAEQVDAGAGPFHLAQLARAYDEPGSAAGLPYVSPSERGIADEHVRH